MENLKTPGVYIRESTTTPSGIVSLGVAGFVGQAQRGPLNFPQEITSWGHFRDIFGDFIGFGYLPYIVFGFFLNGGQRCLVIRVADETAQKAGLELLDENGAPVIEIEALDEGKWGEAVEIDVEEQPDGDSAISSPFKLTIRYRPDGRLRREEVFENLTMDKSHARYFAHVINGDPEVQNYLQRSRNGSSILVHANALCTASDCLSPAPVSAETLIGGSAGTRRLDVRYFTGYENLQYFRPIPAAADDLTRKRLQAQLFGLAAFEAIDEIGSVAIPDLVIPDFYRTTIGDIEEDERIIFTEISPALLTFDNLLTGQRDLLMHCEKMGDRFAILDSPRGSQTKGEHNPIEQWPENFRLQPYAKFGAFYYPWIRERAEDFAGRELLIPPCGHIAGIYARSEREFGVAKAPANEELSGVVDFEFNIGNAEQDILNPRGVNCLRSFPGSGLRVWGARTLSADSQWRYVNIRRFYLAIVKQILVKLQWTVFEPNDSRLWAKIVATLTQFFRSLLQQGALAGNNPEEAFFVKCDAETNPPEVVDRGQVITRIGFAPVRPAEFILLTITRTAESLISSELAGEL